MLNNLCKKNKKCYFVSQLGSFLDLTAKAMLKCKHVERWGGALKYPVSNNK